MYLRIPRELVADPLGSTGHTLGTSGLEGMPACIYTVYRPVYGGCIGKYIYVRI